MTTKCYRIAEKTIDITSLHDEVHRLCASYCVPACEPDLRICIEQADIDFERERSRQQGTYLSSSDAYLETLAVYRKIAEWMPLHNIMLFHGSAIAVDGACYLFAAKSGTGKSTHARLWREMLGDRAMMVNDDKPLLRFTNDGVEVCGTPWNGKHRLDTNTIVPLRAVCLLGRSKSNSICRIDAQDGYVDLLKQTYRPVDVAALTNTLDCLHALATTVPLYRLACNMEPDAAQVSYEAMSGQGQF